MRRTRKFKLQMESETPKIFAVLKVTDLMVCATSEERTRLRHEPGPHTRAHAGLRNLGGTALPASLAGPGEAGRCVQPLSNLGFQH